jgi:hypothetical protein
MRRCVYDEIHALAKRRGVSLASLVDGLIVAELEAEGIHVPEYTALRPRPPRAKREPLVSRLNNPPIDDGRYFGGHVEF